MKLVPLLYFQFASSSVYLLGNKDSLRYQVGSRRNPIIFIIGLKTDRYTLVAGRYRLTL